MLTLFHVLILTSQSVPPSLSIPEKTIQYKIILSRIHCNANSFENEKNA